MITRVGTKEYPNGSLSLKKNLPLGQSIWLWWAINKKKTTREREVDCKKVSTWIGKKCQSYPPYSLIHSWFFWKKKTKEPENKMKMNERTPKKLLLILTAEMSSTCNWKWAAEWYQLKNAETEMIYSWSFIFAISSLLLSMDC